MRDGLPRVLTQLEARQLGLSRSAIDHRIARQGWRRLPGGAVLTAAEEPTRSDWAQVGEHLAGPTAALSGWDALQAVGLGERIPPTGQVLVLSTGGRHRTLPGVRIRPTNRPYARSWIAGEQPEFGRLRRVGVARAIADAALDYRRLRPVRALVTSAVQRGACTPEELDLELSRCPRNYSALLRRAVADVCQGARSVPEAEAAEFLVAAGLPAFELNAPIRNANGAIVAVADVLWRELRAIVEIDSREFHFTEADWKHTIARHNALTALGFAVAHYPPSELNLEWAYHVDAWLQARAGGLRVPYVPNR